MARWSRQAARREGTLISMGLLLLAALGGCQWCPGPPGAGSEGQNQSPATARPAGTGPQVAPEGRIDRARLIKEAERGQQAMVRCLQSERALTDGNELRCEDWSVIRDEFLRP